MINISEFQSNSFKSLKQFEEKVKIRWKKGFFRHTGCVRKIKNTPVWYNYKETDVMYFDLRLYSSGLLAVQIFWGPEFN